MKSYRVLIQQYHIQNIMVYITLVIVHLLLKKDQFSFLLYQPTKLHKVPGIFFEGKVIITNSFSNLSCKLNRLIDLQTQKVLRVW